MQIAESVGGRRRIVRHMGSAHDEAELGLLMAQASKLLQDDAQGQLDLGLSLPVPWAAMVPAPPTSMTKSQPRPSVTLRTSAPQSGVVW